MSARYAIPLPQETVDPGYVALLDRLQRHAFRLDCRYRIPLTRIRVGLDPIVGIVPVVGDLVMAAYSIHLIGLARRLGAGPRLIFLMLANVVVDVCLGIVPFVGPVLDLFFRANVRNLKLLLDEIASARGAGELSPSHVALPQSSS